MIRFSLIALGMLVPAIAFRPECAAAEPPGHACDFDSTATGALPAGWACGDSPGAGKIGVVDDKATASPPRCLKFAGRECRAWLTVPQPADVEVATTVFVSGVSPAGVLARGRDLQGAAPTAYGAGLDRTMAVTLWKWEQGAETSLGVVRAPFLDGVNCRIALRVQNDRLRVRLVRLDTGQFLDSGGAFRVEPAWCIDRADSSIPGPGLVGLAKHANYVETIGYDDFAVADAAGDATPPTVALTVPTDGATVSGAIGLKATATDNSGTVASIEFFVDGSLKGKCIRLPYSLTINTATLSNGPHVLTARAYDLEGNSGSSTPVTVTAANDSAVVRPIIPRHFSHIRIAQLAYSGAQCDAALDRQIRRSVDLVVADVANLKHLQERAPNTPRLLYANVGNLYTDLFFDWLNWADAHGHSREAAFLHVTAPHPGQQSGGSTRRSDQFWFVFRTSGRSLVDQTAGPYESAPAQFGGPGEALYLGYNDPFREINFLGLANRPSGRYALEYPTAVERTGRPTAWSALPVLSDSTAGFTAAGRIVFDPPRDWVACVPRSALKLPGQSPWSGPFRAYFVRVRTTAAGTAPFYRDVKGRNSLRWDGSTWTVPVFDSGADGDSDGYLTDAEYARRAAGKDARFTYESRLLSAYGPQRFASNPANVHFQAWAGSFHRRYLSAYPRADGLFMDNMAGEAPEHHGVSESLTGYVADLAATNQGIWRAIAPKWVLSNTVGVRAADAIAQMTPACYEEFLLRPLTATASTVNDVAATVASRLRQASPPPLVVLDSRSDGSPAAHPYRDPRTTLAILSAYYLLATDATYLNFFGGEQPSTTWADHWIEAAAHDVGTPVGPYATFATGRDPANPDLTYTVFQRRYTRALVLFKPRSERTAPAAVGTVADDTATTHPLDRGYRPLHADGTLGTPIAAIALRNGAGAILIPETDR